MLRCSVYQEKTKLESSLRVKVPSIQVSHAGSSNDVSSNFQIGIDGCLWS